MTRQIGARENGARGGWINERTEDSRLVTDRGSCERVRWPQSADDSFRSGRNEGCAGSPCNTHGRADGQADAISDRLHVADADCHRAAHRDAHDQRHAAAHRNAIPNIKSYSHAGTDTGWRCADPANANSDVSLHLIAAGRR